MTLHHRGLDALTWEAEKDKGSSTPPVTDATTTTPPDAVAGDSSEKTTGTVEELPPWAQSMIKELRTENASRRKAVTEAEKAAALAAEKQLEQQAEWKTLAEQRAAKVQELEPLQGKLAAYEKLLGTQLDAELKAWPKEVLELAPANADMLTRLEWVARSRPLAEKLMATPPANGNGPGPKPAGQAGQKVQDDAARLRFGRHIINQF